MSITTRTKTIISSAVVGLAMLGVSAIPAIAHNHDQVTTSTVASNHSGTMTPTTPGTRLTQEQMNQMMEQCNSMMSMMQNMMDSGNMPGMVNGQNGQPGQDMMNRTRGQ